MLDATYSLLLPYLQDDKTPTLWLADESALTLLEQHRLTPRDNLHLITNRYDVYDKAIEQQISAEFTDFCFTAIPFQPEQIIYRISKEKALVNYLLNQSTQVLAHYPQSKLIIAGKKQEGIKSYANHIKKTLDGNGTLKKSGEEYLGIFSQLQTKQLLNDQAYQYIQAIDTPYQHLPHFYSKPGVFGWNKIDTGSELLLAALPNYVKENAIKTEKILDLGCGYGWIFMNLPHYLGHQLTMENTSIVATDNNAAAIRCAQKNAENYPTRINIVADNCAQHINEQFDLILCNPPFHQGFNHSKALTQLFLQQTQKHLKKDGVAIFVVNEFIKLAEITENNSHSIFSRHDTINHEKGFKVVALRH